MTKIAIILGSTRTNRIGDQVADWVHEVASKQTDTVFDLIDLRDHPLPHLDEPMSPMLGQYQHEHTKAWARTIAPYDGYIFVTPEYNHSVSGVLKNAIDFLHAEWHNKAAGIVSYGIAGGTGAAAQLRTICGQLGMADVSRQVALSVYTDFENYTVFKPGSHGAATLDGLLAEVVAWSEALANLRTESTAPHEAASVGTTSNDAT